MFDLETLQNSLYCACGEVLAKDAINEYCNTCSKTQKACLKCDRYMFICFLNHGLCWDCVNDDQLVPDEKLKCNFCGIYSETPICLTCENDESFDLQDSILTNIDLLPKVLCPQNSVRPIDDSEQRAGQKIEIEPK